MSRNRKEHCSGCLLGGAVDDALGWPVEFEEMSAIVKRFGQKGIQNLQPGAEGLFEITDDTQMTLFTTEGLLRAWTTACRGCGAPDFAAALKSSYLRWLRTQDWTPPKPTRTAGCLKSKGCTSDGRPAILACRFCARGGIPKAASPPTAARGAAGSCARCAAGGQSLRRFGIHRLHHRQHPGCAAGRTGHPPRLAGPTRTGRCHPAGRQ